MEDDPVITSLEQLAAQDEDITLRLYRQFADRRPQDAALMSHMDDYMLGRMMADVLTLVMTPPEDIDRHYLGFEVASHRAYGVTPDMFPPLLEVVRDTVRESLAAQWNGTVETAWQQRITALGQAIATAESAAAGS